MKKILTVVGTRPNIIKITQFRKEAAKYPDIDYKLIHTGQHYSANMNDVFFEELKLQLPDFSLDIDKSSVLKQISGIISGLEETVASYQPDIMVVVGDVNSTLAAAIVANKSGIKLVHIESGLRSYDKEMPEEHNRVMTDAITDIFFITEQSGWDNLISEGHDKDKMHFVGNTMIDTLVAYDNDIRNSKVLDHVNPSRDDYALMTMHRPGNVDNIQGLQKLSEIIVALSKEMKVIFPIHPRTKKRLEEFGLSDQFKNDNLVLVDPMGYLDFQNLILNSVLVITDSGGIQEETTFRQIPCITLRPNTERPSTLEIGSNTLMEFDVDKILDTVNAIKSGTYKSYSIPEKWDGKATERIFKVLSEL